MALAVFALTNGTIANAQPKITKQPTDQFVDLGKAFQLSFVASSSQFPLTNQWFFNGAALADATNSFLRFTNAQPSLNGSYFAVRSDASGSVTSVVVRVTVFASVPHGLSGLMATPGQPVTLALMGETPALFEPYFDLYPLEVSTNLVDWSPLLTLERTNALLTSLTFLDADASGLNERFYRTPTNLFLTPLPPLTGPYPVGTFSRLLTDPSRTNTVRHTNQQFMVTVWYPADPSAGVWPEAYMEQKLISLYSQNFFGWPAFANLVPRFVGHSCANLPLATAQTRWPVVLYSPSINSYRRENVSKVEELASHGFIVVGLDHRSTLASLFPDGKVVRGSLVDQSSTAAILKDLQDRAADARFVINQITQWDGDDPFFNGHLDLQHIGAFGFSIGGATAAELCRTDARCRAGVGMDGYFINTNLLTTPFLMFHSDDGAGPEGTSDERRSVILQMSKDAYLVTTSGTVHWSHSDMPLIADKNSFQSMFGTPPHALIDGVRVNQIVSTYLVSFFRKYLRGEDDHLLDGPPSQFPEIIEFYRK